MSIQIVWAIFRRERKAEVLRRLEAEGFFAMTEMTVFGRGQQRGVQVGAVSYEELAKTMLLIAVEEQQCPRVVEAIEAGAHTGHPGDGKIFIQPVREVYTVRTGKPELEGRKKTSRSQGGEEEREEG